MLLLQQLCASLLDQVSGVEVHLALLLEPSELIFQPLTPIAPENIVYHRIPLHARAI